MIKNTLKKILGEIISELYSLDAEIVLTAPPNVALGNFSFGCFEIAKQIGKSPAEVATELSQKITKYNEIETAKATGPYLNIKLPNKLFFQEIIKEILDQKNNFGHNKMLSGQKVMVEYLSPNTNKPLHLGHVRNGALGTAISNILEANGADVIRANLVNDRGIHIAKSMLAWKKWGEGETPESAKMKGDHFVGKWYIRFATESEKDPTLIDQAQEMLQKWEANDPETIALWKKMNKWVFAGFEESFEKFDLRFDQIYLESETYKLGKEIVEMGLEKGVFQREENGAITSILPEAEFGLEKDGSPKKTTLIRGDGTSVYITQDLGTTLMKFKENNLDQAFWVVGSEQDYHFKVLFSILKRLGYSWADKCYHLSYGMVYLPEGKMKSREGKIVDADDLYDGMKAMAKEEILKRDHDDKISEPETDERSGKVALAAINYYLLQTSPKQDIHFDPKASLAFEGNTGPYCQYTYARASGILEKATKIIALPDYNLLGNEEELTLAAKLIEFPEQVELAAKEHNPTKIATMTFEIAKSFNQLYQKHPVLSAENPDLIAARIMIVKATANVLENGLSLLGIPSTKKM